MEGTLWGHGWWMFQQNLCGADFFSIFWIFLECIYLFSFFCSKIDFWVDFYEIWLENVFFVGFPVKFQPTKKPKASQTSLQTSAQSVVSPGLQPSSAQLRMSGKNTAKSPTTMSQEFRING